MDVALALLPVILIGAYMFVWVSMIVHALSRPIPHQILWLVVLIFVPILGTVAYYFAFYLGTTKLKPLYKSAVSVGLALFCLIGLIASVSTFVFPPQPRLSEVPLAQVIQEANGGAIQRIIVKGDELTIIKKGKAGPTERSHKKSGSSLYEQGLMNKNVEIEVVVE